MKNLIVPASVLGCALATMVLGSTMGVFGLIVGICILMLGAMWGEDLEERKEGAA